MLKNTLLLALLLTLPTLSLAQAWTKNTLKITNIQVDHSYDYDIVITFDNYVNGGCLNKNQGRINASAIPLTARNHILSIALTAFTTGKPVIMDVRNH